MMRAPISLAAFLLTGALFLAQSVPLVGVFLMIVGAPYWSILFVNMGFAGIAVEATWAKRVNALWLILPLAWFGGGVAVAAVDHITLHRLRNEIVEANGDARIAFDPAKQALVFVGEEQGFRNDTLTWLVSNRDLPVVYHQRAPLSYEFNSIQLAERSLCRPVPTVGLRITGMPNDGGHDTRRRRLDKRFCTLSIPVDPPVERITVTRQQRREVREGLPAWIDTTAIALPEGRQVLITTGRAAPYPWIPMPVLGFALNSNRAKWQMIATFKRSEYRALIAEGASHPGSIYEARTPDILLARALGLKPVTAANRRARTSEAVKAAVATADARAFEIQRDQMLYALEHPEAAVGNWPRVPENAALIDPYVPRLAEGLARSVKLGERGEETGRFLSRWLANASDDALRPYGFRLLPLYANAKAGDWIIETPELVARTHVYSVVAAPMLVARLEGPRHDKEAVIALCKIGPYAAPAAREPLMALWNARDTRFGLDDLAVYVALLRLGVGSEVGPVEGRKRWKAAMDRAKARVTPASAPEVCDPDGVEELWFGRRIDRPKTYL